MTDQSTDDIPSLKEYLRASRSYATWFLYASVLVYALAYSSFTFTLSNTNELPEPMLLAVSIAMLCCLLGAPIAIWRDATAIRDWGDWTPTRPLYAIGSLLAGVPGIFVLVYYLHTRRMVVREAYYEELGPEE